MIRIADLPSRTLFALVALALVAGCAGGNSSADLSPAAPQQTAAPEPAAPSPAPASRPAPAGRKNQIAAPASAPPAQDAVLTPEKIKADCWMKYENDKKIKNVDARLALVEKCVDETSRGQPPQR
jgi:ABC-type glycerol-3-phosphate transport system substrate-binding protein